MDERLGGPLRARRQRPGSIQIPRPYVFRVAISNNRILKIEDGQVTFKYEESATDQIKFCTVPAEEFIR